MVIVGVLILLQAYILGSAVMWLTEYFVYVYFIFTVISLIVVIYILGTKSNPSYKLAWVIPILLVPVFGGLFYLIFGLSKMSKKFRERVEKATQDTNPLLIQNEGILEELKNQDIYAFQQANYIQKFSSFPVHKNTQSEYLSSGEAFFEALKTEMEKAEHYIFMEYFIVQEGIMWDSLLEIMLRKVKEGVDVRMMYDDAGTIQTLPYKYNEQLEEVGIKTVVFNEIKPRLSLGMNNRDHRKITVIDGHTGFVGGVNLADEYINVFEKYGHWKDAAIMLKGDGVWNLTVMFLQAWSFECKEEEDYETFRPRFHCTECFLTDGYVQPYGDSPLDDEIVGENVYLNMINQAKKYLYIQTPYLVVDNELVTALSLAAKKGVDVRIITPHKEDKWYVHILTKSYYAGLIEAGVKIYEYTPGFVHAKTFVADDEVGVVGTINLDYRSLYLHFECATWLYKTQSISDIKKDFIKTLEICEEITLERAIAAKWYTKITRAVLRVFAPLM
jgi:cardiolipin synthase